jgi:hypothetical protein
MDFTRTLRRLARLKAGTAAGAKPNASQAAAQRLDHVFDESRVGRMWTEAGAA